MAAGMAGEAGIRMSSLQGRGPGGRIVKRDIEAAMTEKPRAKAAPPVPLAALNRPAEKGAVYGPSAYRDEPVSEMRRTIAKRLVTSLGPAPHFFLTVETDMERAADLRRSITELYPHRQLSVNDDFIHF